MAKARWVEDGKYFTSSGVSAGMDMTLAVIAKLCGRKRVCKSQAARNTNGMRIVRGTRLLLHFIEKVEG